MDTTTGSTSKDSTPTVAASSSKTLKTAATSSPKIIPHLPKQSLIKQKSMGLTGTVTSSPLVIRKRSSSLHLSTSAPQPETALSKGGGAKSGKSPLLKQQTIPEFGKNQGPFSKRRSAPDIERASEVQQEEKANNEGREKEWRGLKVGVLRNRIQRLIVLMNLSEPGTIPDAEMLASLIDLVSWRGIVPMSYYADTHTIVHCVLCASNFELSKLLGTKDLILTCMHASLTFDRYCKTVVLRSVLYCVCSDMHEFFGEFVVIRVTYNNF